MNSVPVEIYSFILVPFQFERREHELVHPKTPAAYCVGSLRYGYRVIAPEVSFLKEEFTACRSELICCKRKPGKFIAFRVRDYGLKPGAFGNGGEGIGPGVGNCLEVYCLSGIEGAPVQQNHA